MYSIDKNLNAIQKINEKSFSELGFKGREHLQEWILKEPESLGEDLLIIQKEFDGFNGTYERLDLLAVDKQGNLVIIENKLDDSGKDVTWQALKYASYCSTLKKDQIRKIYQEFLDKEANGETAEENLIEFFEVGDFSEVVINSGQTQRIILIAANFRKEVTSTVLWLLNYKLRIQCFKVTPFENNGTLLLNIEQIIPMRESEEYVISMADKTQESINTQEKLKLKDSPAEFWKEFLKKMNEKSTLFHHVNPSERKYILGLTGISGILWGQSIVKSAASTEIYLGRKSKEKNKFIFDELIKSKEEIEKQFGESLNWERLDNKDACRIRGPMMENVNYTNKDDWSKMIGFMVDSILRMEKAFKEPLSRVKLKL